MIGDEPRTVYNIDQIDDHVITDMAKSRNKIYALEYEIKSKDGGEKPREVEDVYANADYDWYIKKTQFERESNIYACLSLRSKLHMMGLDYVAESVGTPKAIDEKAYLEQVIFSIICRRTLALMQMERTSMQLHHSVFLL